jgi:hypothetical protein
MKCQNHPDKEVKGACVGCGNFFCEDCLTQVHGKNYCKKCLVEIAEKQDSDRTERTTAQPQIIIQQNQQQQQQQKSAKKSEWGIIVLVCCILLFILFLIGMAMSAGHH